LKIVHFSDTHLGFSDKAISQIELCEEQIDKSKKNIMMMHCSVGVSNEL